MQTTFDYGVTRVREMTIHTRQTPVGKNVANEIEIQGQAYKPSPRFWNSFFHRYGFSENIFRYFDHAEVFERVSARSKDDTIRFCVEQRGEKKILLAVSNPSKPLVRHDDLIDVIQRYGGEDVQYHDGIVSSTHSPRSADTVFKVGVDEFKHRFVMDTPIDGYSSPRIHLSFLRLLCSNGAVGYTRAFRSELTLGKDPFHGITRAMESYDNGDGYSALRQRFENAQKSWASVQECNQLYRILVRLSNQNEFQRAGILGDFHKMTGHINELYGLANLDALSLKRQRILPSKCRVYDLLNFASEVATHYAAPQGARSLQAFIGGLIADEYDMEGTADRVADFDDFFVGGPDQVPFSHN